MGDPKRLNVSAVAGAIAIVCCLLLIAFISIPHRISSDHRKTNAIINNLRQIDGALQVWALDHGQSNAVTVPREALMPYLWKPPPWVNPVAGERYLIKATTESPEAQLTREVEGYPQGTVLRFGTNGEPQIIPPNKEIRTNPR